MLIVFAQENDQSAETVCENALRAAEAALSDLGKVNEDRSKAGLPSLRFGVGLHYGEVVYGNVGGTHRLDFTVMGVAVNRTARLESLTKQIGTLIDVRCAGKPYHGPNGLLRGLCGQGRYRAADRTCP